LLAKWVAGLTIIYTIILLFIMYVSPISITPSIWVVAWLFGLGMAGIVTIGTSASKIGLPWKLQRISAGFLMLTIPIHMVLMHANPMVGHDSALIIARVRGDILIKITDFFILVSALYHGAYGLVSIAKDYLKSKKLIQSVLILIIIVSMLFAWLGMKTIIIL
jgi:succinate dehydrogenase hydrophobic anchor subunit